MSMSRKIIWALAILIALPLPAASASNSVKSTGSNGASISISKSSYTKNSRVAVTGSGFDETVGIYLAYCVMPKKNKIPTPCGGGTNKAGTGDASFWISSNPPPYGIDLAIPYTPGGRFKQVVDVTKMIGKFDCRKVKCAITVRSDHLREGDRSHDIFIPISFK